APEKPLALTYLESKSVVAPRDISLDLRTSRNLILHLICGRSSTSSILTTLPDASVMIDPLRILLARLPTSSPLPSPALKLPESADWLLLSLTTFPPGPVR